MKHPSEATLALYAGGDLGLWERWHTRRHLNICGRCRREVEAYFSDGVQSAELAELPGIAWNQLAAEMKANIRLGVVAGECVAASTAAPQSLARPRALVALASAFALIVTGIVLDHPRPRPAASERTEGVVLGATESGIELKSGGQGIQLLHGHGRGVLYSAGAQGSVRARYVDSETGYITINNVYGQ
jgi:hypothetical protein